jgi:membrane-associated phospholipid phosphatase
MAFARVYVGAHYPGDVAAGLLLGATFTIAFSRLGARVFEPILTAVSKTPLRVLITNEPKVKIEFVRT